MNISKYLSVAVLFVLIGACSEDNPIIQEPETPIYQYTKEKEYLFEVKLYSDVMKFFKYNTKVSQTNPNVAVPAEILKHMEDSINERVIYPVTWNPQEAIIDNIGFEINEHTFDKFSLGLSVNVAKPGEPITEDKYVTKKYSIHGRDSIINLFNRQNVSGHFTTFENRPTTFRPSIDIDYRNNLVGFDKGDDAYFCFCDSKFGYSSDIQVPSNASFQIPSVIQTPDIYINEHALVYDRFNERTYISENGTEYKTTVVVKKLTDIKDFDPSAPTPDKPDLTKNYPIIQFYKNNNLWLEAWISKYTEEFEYNRSDNKTTTEVSFDCYTLKGGYQYWIRYDSRKLTIYISDFSKPNGNDDFTRVDTQIINFVNDKKSNSKGTISIE